MSEENPSAERIAHHYKAMQDSVTTLNAGQPSTMPDAEWAACKASNVAHLELMKTRSYWTTEDMTAVNKAIADHK
tara:strand:- start:272 stop:496 length:225 start_codon:yes stop_codon:yes gene_type:complete